MRNSSAARSALFLHALLYLLVLSCTKDERTKSELAAAVDSIFLRVPDFSGVVLIAAEGTPVVHKAFGYSNFEDSIRMDTTAVFELASVSKQFTAMIIMILDQEGKLRYDDLVEKYIPGLPYPGITIRHLLNHTSGLPDYQAIMDEHWDKRKIAGNEENIEYLRKFHPPANFSPGEKFEYSNTGYMLLATIAEKASGEDFVELSREKIFLPSGMESTDIRTNEDKVRLEKMAWGYIYVPARKMHVSADSFPALNYTIWLGNRTGPGRISSTSSDLLKWDQALYKEKLIDRSALAEAFRPARLADNATSYYGFGWYIVEHPEEGLIVYHKGDNPGYKTGISRYLDKKRCLILLNNNAHAEFDTVFTKLSSLVGSYED